MIRLTENKQDGYQYKNDFLTKSELENHKKTRQTKYPDSSFIEEEVFKTVRAGFTNKRGYELTQTGFMTLAEIDRENYELSRKYKNLRISVTD